MSSLTATLRPERPDDKDAWRGVAAEDVDEVPPEVSRARRRSGTRLVGELVAPYRGRMVLAGLAILGRTGATLTIPWLVGQAVDHGIRAVRANDPGPLEAYVAYLVVTAFVLGGCGYAFLRLSGWVGREVL